MKKINTEKKIENCNFKVKIGTTNKSNPQTIYVESGAFISPLTDRESYKRDMTILEKEINKALKNELKESSLFEPNYICNFEVASDRMKKGKKSYISLQYHLKQKKVIPIKEITEKSKPMVNKIFDIIKDNIIENNYAISKSKK